MDEFSPERNMGFPSELFFQRTEILLMLKFEGNNASFTSGKR